MRLGPDERRALMARFRSTDTHPELALRRALRIAGIVGYRLHMSKLPGRPDVAFTRWRVAVFVDGEFWHGHPAVFQFGTKGPYWDAKIARNQARDVASNRALSDAGWSVVRFWSRDISRNAPAAVATVSRALARAGKDAGRGRSAASKIRMND